MMEKKQNKKKGFTRRQFLVGATAAAGTAALAACGGKKEKPKLSVWTGQTYTPEADEKYEEQVRAWCDENDVELDYSYMAQDESQARWQVAMESKEFPDLGGVQPENYMRHVLAGDLVETTDIVNRLNGQGGGLTDGSLSALNIEGKYYAVPTYGSTEMYYVRKDKLDEKGLDVPDTWEDVVAIAEAITEPGEFWGWGPQLGTASWDSEVALSSKLWAHGAKTWDEDGNPALDSAETRLVLDMMKGAWEAGWIPPDAPTWDDSGNNTAYLTGIVGMVFNTGSILRAMQNDDPDLLAKSAFIPIPKGPAGRFCSGYFYREGVYSNSEFQDEALALLEHLWEPEQTMERVRLAAGNRLPFYKGLFDDPMWDETGLDIQAAMLPFTVHQGYPGPLSPWCLDAWLTDHLVATMFGRVLFEGWDNDRAIDEAMGTAKKWYDEWQETLKEA
jgi:multiple sugar transport system substrate-binding protein